MVKYKNKNLKITLSLVVSTMSIVMANCMEDQGSGSSSSNAPAASGSSSSNAPAPEDFVTDHLLESINNQNELEAQVRQLQGANDDLRDQLGVQQQASLEGHGAVLTEHSRLRVDLMRHIEDLNRHRVQDKEYLRNQIAQLNEQKVTEIEYLRNQIAQLNEQILSASKNSQRERVTDIEYFHDKIQCLDDNIRWLNEARLNDIRQLNEQILSQNRETRSLRTHLQWVQLICIVSILGLHLSTAFYSK